MINCVMIKHLIRLVWFAFPVLLHGQMANTELIKSQIIPPVLHPIVLSGSFGEIRPSHFHMGIDIKSSRRYKEDPVVTVADGYISRIKISPGGYGRSVYVDHPNLGITTLYAHLDIFDPAIESWINLVQREKMSYAVDTTLTESIFPLKQGDRLGILGNTGHSFGPHLHFEMRESRTETPINPFLVGLKSSDVRPPKILSIAVHGLDSAYYKIHEQRLALKALTTMAQAEPVVIHVPANQAGVALHGFDQMDGAENKNGIYAIRMFVDDTLKYYYTMDRLDFNESRQVSGFVDYEIHSGKGEPFILCYTYPGNNLQILRHQGDGCIALSQEKTRTIRLEAMDYDNNVSEVIFYVKQDSFILKNQNISAPLILRPDDSLDIVYKNARFEFAKGSVFRNLSLDVKDRKAGNGMSIYSLNKDKEPLKNEFKVYIKPDISIESWKDKAVICLLNQKNGKINLGGTWNGDTLSTVSRELGSFYIMPDTITPTIIPVDFTTKPTRKRNFAFKVRDDLPCRLPARDMEWDVWIDNEWVICPMKSMHHRLEIPLTGLKPGRHILKIEARDHSGNTAIFEKSFNLLKP
jgi:hypothetical protein